MKKVSNVVERINLLKKRDFAPFPTSLYEAKIKQELHACKNVLISEGENFLFLIDEMVLSFPGINFFIAIRNKEILNELKNNNPYKNLNFAEYETEIKIKNINNNFDLILSFPPMGGKLQREKCNFISFYIEEAETEYLLPFLNKKGKLIALLPYSTTFRNNSNSTKFREFIEINYKINSISAMQSGLLAPYSNVHTFLISIGQGKTNNVFVENYTLGNRNKTLNLTYNANLNIKKIQEKSSWDINALSVDEDSYVKKYLSNNKTKNKLSELADVYRGKTINQYSEKGNIAVINISDIKDFKVDFKNIKYINEDERKNKRFELIDGDILLTARGTDIRTAIFRKPDEKMYIASANLIVIHQNNESKQEEIQLFLESCIGRKLLEACKKGTAMMNIIPQDIKDIIIPNLKDKKLQEIVQKYVIAKKNLIIEKREAEQRIINAQNNLKNICEEYVDSLL